MSYPITAFIMAGILILHFSSETEATETLSPLASGTINSPCFSS